MTVLVEKYIELPFEYSSDEEALDYIETLMMLGEWQAICDVIQRDSSGAVVDCPDGVPALYFDDEMQVVLFTVSKEVTEEQPTGEFDHEGTPLYAEVDGTHTQLRAVSYFPEREDDA